MSSRFHSWYAYTVNRVQILVSGIPNLLPWREPWTAPPIHRFTRGRASRVQRSRRATMCPVGSIGRRELLQRGPGWRAVRLCHLPHVEHPFLPDGSPTSGSPASPRGCAPAGAGSIPPGRPAPAGRVQSRRYTFFPLRQNSRSPSAEAEPPQQASWTLQRTCWGTPRDIARAAPENAGEPRVAGLRPAPEPLDQCPEGLLAIGSCHSSGPPTVGEGPNGFALRSLCDTRQEAGRWSAAASLFSLPPLGSKGQGRS